MGDRDEPRPETPAQIITHARLTAQATGRPELDEMIAALDEMIASRCLSAEAACIAYGKETIDWRVWGRTTYVYESVMAFLQRLEGDESLRREITRRLRGGGRTNVDRRGHPAPPRSDRDDVGGGDRQGHGPDQERGDLEG